MLHSDAIAKFRSELRGQVIEPGDREYEDARQVYNGMISRKPALIARCADVADVMTAIRFAREQEIVASIRGGGHNAGGLGLCDGGVGIDLGLIKYGHVGPASQTGRGGGGRPRARVGHAPPAVGPAVPSGGTLSPGVRRAALR